VTESVLNPFDRDLLRDPVPTYRMLRADPQLHRSTVGAWVVTRYADARVLTRDPAGLMQPPGESGAEAFGDGAAARIFSGLMVASDPPMHTRLRALAERALTRRAVADLRVHIEQVVDDALDGIAPGADFDGIRDFAYLIPYRVICGMLGVPEGERDMVLSWTPDFFRIFLPGANDEAGIAACNRACEFFLEYLGEQIEWRRRNPGPDLFSALIHAEEHGDQLSHDELVANVLALLTGGFDTTMGMLSAGLYALAGEPGQFATLRADPAEIAPRAVDELLRWESPVQVTFRHFAQERRVGETVIPAGEPIWVVLAAANRDDAEFDDPDLLDLARTPNRHLAFGGGRHFCIGSHLARLEGVVALERIARRWAALEPAGEPSRRESMQFRSFDRLPLRLTEPG
jgi:cytochrome P450